jgi:hypothetical protein
MLGYWPQVSSRLAAVLFPVAFEICQRRFADCPRLLGSFPPFNACHVGNPLASIKDLAGGGEVYAVEPVPLFAGHAL